MTLAEWKRLKILHDAEVTAGKKRGPFTIPKPKKIIGGPKIGTMNISKYYSKGGYVITGRD